MKAKWSPRTLCVALKLIQICCSLSLILVPFGVSAWLKHAIPSITTIEAFGHNILCSIVCFVKKWRQNGPPRTLCVALKLIQICCSTSLILVPYGVSACLKHAIPSTITIEAFGHNILCIIVCFVKNEGKMVPPHPVRGLEIDSNLLFNVANLGSIWSQRMFETCNPIYYNHRSFWT